MRPTTLAGHRHEGEEIAAERTGVRRFGCAAEPVRERVDRQVGLVRPGPVDGRLAGPGPRRDGIHGHLVVADLAEHLEGRVADRLVARRSGGPDGTGRGLHTHLHKYETKPFRTAIYLRSGDLETWFAARCA